MAEDQTSGYSTPALEKWRRRTDGPLMMLALASLPFLLLEVERSSLPNHDQIVMDIVNLTVLLAFLVDYVVELRLAANRRNFVRSEWTSLAIVVAQAIAVLPGLYGFGIARAARGARVIRGAVTVMRLMALGGAARTEGRQMLRRSAGSFAVGTAILTWLTSAAAFTIVEDVGRDGRVGSFFDALWWSAATITTVGYGDIFPVTAAGRIVGGFTMVIGISTFALVTAKIAAFLVRDEDDTAVDAGVPLSPTRTPVGGDFLG